jgi:hypothetical protein
MTLLTRPDRPKAGHADDDRLKPASFAVYQAAEELVRPDFRRDCGWRSKRGRGRSCYEHRERRAHGCEPS